MGEDSRPSATPLTALAVCLTVSFGLLLFACSNPRTNPQTNNPPQGNSSDDTEGGEPRPAVSLRPVSKSNERFRTTRKLRVEEATETERYVTESEEVTLTDVLRTDDSGRMLRVRRTWESSLTRLIQGYGDGETAKGALDGCTLELTQRANGVVAKVVAGRANISGANFLIEGFDTALLPLDPVRENDYWVLQGSRIAGLNRFIEAMQFKIDKNKLTCQLADTTTAQARISIEWRITGELDGVLAVLEFDGELVFSREHKIITRFELSGGRQSDNGTKRQIEISITRRPVSGWLDLDR